MLALSSICICTNMQNGVGCLFYKDSRKLRAYLRYLDTRLLWGGDDSSGKMHWRRD